MAKQQIDKLNSQASLEQLASYILRAANQGEIIDDTTTVNDQTWSSKKVSDELEDALDTVADTYVEKTQGTTHSEKYMRVDSNGDIAPEPMSFESQNIDFSTDW